MFVLVNMKKSFPWIILKKTRNVKLRNLETMMIQCFDNVCSIGQCINGLQANGMRVFALFSFSLSSPPKLKILKVLTPIIYMHH